MLETLVGRVNAAIDEVNAGAPTPRQHRRQLVLADELARYDEACDRSSGPDLDPSRLNPDRRAT